MTDHGKRVADEELMHWLADAPTADGVRRLDQIPPTSQASGQRPTFRRSQAPGQTLAAPPQQEIISLVRADGVLRWRHGVVAARAGGPRAAGRAALAGGEVIKQYAFEKLEGSDVYKALDALDRQLTPKASYSSLPGTGLRQYKGGVLVEFKDVKKAAGKNVLVVVHGTFSNSEAILVDGLPHAPHGAKLLADAEKHYDLVLAYDHPTLSVSPMLNAFDLAALLRPSPASIDIVCHSRGGLVARWFCEAFADPALRRRVVFVASPLAGTSLAAAPRLRSTLDLLTNISNTLRMASDLAAANPLFLAASGLLRVVSTVTRIGASTPLLDAAIALVPGLDAQSRVGNNQELLRLRANTGNADFNSAAVRYFAVKGNFEPQAIGWNFLRLFSKPMQRAGDLAADIIFDGANDLVVDTTSMDQVADGRQIVIAHDFGTQDTVHHVNYFRQPQTVDAIRASLQIP